MTLQPDQTRGTNPDLTPASDPTDRASAATGIVTAPNVASKFLSQEAGYNINVSRTAGVWDIEIKDGKALVGNIKVYPDGQHTVSGDMKTETHRFSASGERAEVGIQITERGATAAFRRAFADVLDLSFAAHDRSVSIHLISADAVRIRSDVDQPAWHEVSLN